jgi:hypothetical protein
VGSIPIVKEPPAGYEPPTVVFKTFSCGPSRSAPMFIRLFRKGGSVELYEDRADVVLPWSPEPPQ